MVPGSPLLVVAEMGTRLAMGALKRLMVFHPKHSILDQQGSCQPWQNTLNCRKEIMKRSTDKTDQRATAL